jgi:heptosyltransferase-2
MSTVVPPALRRGNPGARIGVLAPAGLGDVFRGLPGLDEVREFPPGGEVDAYRAARYDRVLLAPVSFGSAWRARRGGVRNVSGFGGAGRGILLRRRLPAGEYRRDRHQVENYRALAALAGEPSEVDEPRVVVDPDLRGEAEALWGGAGRPRVALQPGATYGPAKRWPAERFAGLARALAADGCVVALLGGPGDREVVDRVRSEIGRKVLDLAGKTRVGTLAAVLAAADALVSNDTGPMHLGAAVGTPVVAIFGSTDPGWTGPRGEGHRVLRHRVECAPCFRRTCDIGLVCLERIAIDEVRDATRAILKRGPREDRS